MRGARLYHELRRSRWPVSVQGTTAYLRVLAQFRLCLHVHMLQHGAVRWVDVETVTKLIRTAASKALVERAPRDLLQPSVKDAAAHGRLSEGRAFSFLK